jgi:hypothetical protein
VFYPFAGKATGRQELAPTALRLRKVPPVLVCTSWTASARSHAHNCRSASPGRAANARTERHQLSGAQRALQARMRSCRPIARNAGSGAPQAVALRVVMCVVRLWRSVGECLLVGKRCP